jgi:hypothetical protein
MKLEDHPTVQRIRLKSAPSAAPPKEPLNAQWLKQLVLEAGADDVGFVGDRPTRLGRSASGHPQGVPPRQDADQLRGSHES